MTTTSSSSCTTAAPTPVDLSGLAVHRRHRLHVSRPAPRSPAGGYLVVAKDRLRLLANHPGLEPEPGVRRLRRRAGQRRRTARPGQAGPIIVTNEFGLLETNRVYIEVDEVTYGTGGRWGQWSDGLGSSLELVDPAQRSPRARRTGPTPTRPPRRRGAPSSSPGALDNGDGGAVEPAADHAAGRRANAWWTMSKSFPAAARTG